MRLGAALGLHILPGIWQRAPYRAASPSLQGNQTGELGRLSEGTQENSDADALSTWGAPSRGLGAGPPGRLTAGRRLIHSQPAVRTGGCLECGFIQGLPRRSGPVAEEVPNAE